MKKSKKSDLFTIAEKEKSKCEAESVTNGVKKEKCPEELVTDREEKAKLEDELVIAREDKAELEYELIIANKEIAKRAAELVIANEEKAKRAAELVIANEEKAKRAAELVIANAEKAKRAAELVIANAEKVKRAAGLVIANLEKAKRADELIIADKELAYQNEEKVKRAAELVIADVNKTKREAELVIAKIEKAKRIAKSIIADKELSFQTEEKSKRAAELVIADAEKAKREAELVIANINKANRSAELVIANVEKAKRSAELIIANKELIYQKSEKAKRAAELIIANVEKAKRAAELVVAKIEKANRAAELVVANKELVLATERANLTAELIIINKELSSQITERMKMELSLEESKKTAERYLNVAAELIMSLDELGNITMLNDSGHRLLGYNKAELIGKNWVNTCLPHKISGEVSGIFEKLMRGDTENLENNENLVLTKSGELKTIQFYNTTLKDIDGTIKGVISSGRDITGHLKNEEALRNSFVFSETILKTIPFGMDIVDEKGTILFQSDNFKKIFGEKAIGGKCWELYRDDKKQCRDCPLFTGIIIGETETYESHGVLGGRIFNISHTGMLYQGKKAMLEIFQDITERKQAENLLKASEKKSMSIMENSADAIFITNKQGKYVYTNKAVTDLLGYTQEEMKSKSIVDITPPDLMEEYLNVFHKIMNEGKAYAEIELIKKDGNYILTDLNAVLLPDGTVYGSCRDITERKKAESELIKAKEKAEESDRLKSAFLTNMSHEIRTPMNGILGFAELLKKNDLTIDEQQDYIQTMQISGARMLSTINSIVDISRIESGLIGIDIKETNINEKIEFIYKFFKPEVETKGLQFIFRNGLPANEAFIKTDNEKVYGILTNLVRNAIKFTFDGSIEFGYEKKGEYLEFFVKDTGTGIPKKQQQLVFERFRQGSESHNRGYEGSGLGLSISKSYVEMLGGRIWVESEDGLGSTFYFTIPYNRVSEVITTGKDVVSEVNNDAQINKLKILIVEDDEVSYSLLIRTIQKISKEVLRAVTGVEAVETCRNNPDLDLILMDIRMPMMNGLEATQQIRQFNKDVIIIAQTAYAFAGDSEKALEAGCNDYISKPIDKNLLYELIKKHFIN